MSNGICYVYWAHLPEHHDMLTQGYVGITTGTVKQRWAAHVSKSMRKKNECYILEYAIRKYGDRIIVETLWQDTVENCMQFEYDLRPEQYLGWNAGIGGTFNRVGVPMSEEQKAKISATLKGRKHPPERVEKIRLAMIGVSRNKGISKSPEHVEKMRQNMINRWRDPDARRAMLEPRRKARR